jgi:hypothetical protein
MPPHLVCAQVPEAQSASLVQAVGRGPQVAAAAVDIAPPVSFQQQALSPTAFELSQRMNMPPLARHAS